MILTGAIGRAMVLCNHQCLGVYHRPLLQTEKSQPGSKRIMPETRGTEFPELSVDPRVGISRSALETDI